jgi:hypothetical protein
MVQEAKKLSSKSLQLSLFAGTQNTTRVLSPVIEK